MAKDIMNITVRVIIVSLEIQTVYFMNISHKLYRLSLDSNINRPRPPPPFSFVTYHSFIILSSVVVLYWYWNHRKIYHERNKNKGIYGGAYNPVLCVITHHNKNRSFHIRSPFGFLWRRIKTIISPQVIYFHTNSPFSESMNISILIYYERYKLRH